jgi:hypothetical protein
MTTLTTTLTSCPRRRAPTTRFSGGAVSEAWRAGMLAWIPAFAGMTEMVGQPSRFETSVPPRQASVDGRLRGHDEMEWPLEETQKLTGISREGSVG